MHLKFIIIHYNPIIFLNQKKLPELAISNVVLEFLIQCVLPAIHTRSSLK